VAPDKAAKFAKMRERFNRRLKELKEKFSECETGDCDGEAFDREVGRDGPFTELKHELEADLAESDLLEDPELAARQNAARTMGAEESDLETAMMGKGPRPTPSPTKAQVRTIWRMCPGQDPIRYTTVSKPTTREADAHARTHLSNCAHNCAHNRAYKCQGGGNCIAKTVHGHKAPPRIPCSHASASGKWVRTGQYSNGGHEISYTEGVSRVSGTERGSETEVGVETAIEGKLFGNGFEVAASLATSLAHSTSQSISKDTSTTYTATLPAGSVWQFEYAITDTCGVRGLKTSALVATHGAHQQPCCLPHYFMDSSNPNAHSACRPGTPCLPGCSKSVCSVEQVEEVEVLTPVQKERKFVSEIASDLHAMEHEYRKKTKHPHRFKAIMGKAKKCGKKLEDYADNVAPDKAAKFAKMRERFNRRLKELKEKFSECETGDCDGEAFDREVGRDGPFTELKHELEADLAESDLLEDPELAARQNAARTMGAEESDLETAMMGKGPRPTPSPTKAQVRTIWRMCPGQDPIRYTTVRKPTKSQADSEANKHLGNCRHACAHNSRYKCLGGAKCQAQLKAADEHSPPRALPCTGASAKGVWTPTGQYSNGGHEIAYTEGASVENGVARSNSVTAGIAASISAGFEIFGSGITTTVTASVANTQSSSVSSSLAKSTETSYNAILPAGTVWQFRYEVEDTCGARLLKTSALVSTNSLHEKPCCLPHYFLDPHNTNAHGRCVPNTPCMCDKKTCFG